MYNILLIGETCRDEYIYGICDRVCPEAAALVFTRTDDLITFNHGMAGNVYRNLISIDKNILNITFLTNSNINSSIIKRRYIDKRYNTIVLREDIYGKIDKLDFLTNFNYKDINKNYDLIIISDYNKGLIDIKDYHDIRKIYPNTKILVDTKQKVTVDIAKNIDYLKINKLEYSDIKHNQDVHSLCDIIVTKGDCGADLYKKNNKKVFSFPTKKIEVRDVCGAGDTFLAALAIKYLYTRNICDSIDFANECAGKVVTKFGVATP